MREPSKMKRGSLATMLCAATFLTACGDKVGFDPAFKDVQRRPPLTKTETVEYLVTHDRLMAEWVSETAKKCDKFGCAK